MVYNKFTQYEHGLKLEDTTGKDHQNWASSQRLCQGKYDIGLHIFVHHLRHIKSGHLEQTNV